MPQRDDEYDDNRDDRARRPRDRDDDYDRRPRKKSNTVLIVLLAVLGVLVVCGVPTCIGLLLPAVQSVREAANRMKSSNNLKEIGLGLYNYQTAHGELPGNTYGPDGKALLSWRVHILPFVGHDDLYRQFKLDEPWDSPNNMPLVQSMPELFVIPATRGQTPAGFTHYRGFSSPGAVFDRRLAANQKRRPGEWLTTAGFRDGASATALVVEAADPVEWTRPDDLDASPGKPVPKMGGFYKRTRFQVLLGDGTVKVLPVALPEATLRGLATHSAGDTLPAGWDIDS